MTDYEALLLRQLQDQIALDVQNATSFEERNRLTVYWYRLNGLTHPPTEV